MPILIVDFFEIVDFQQKQTQVPLISFTTGDFNDRNFYKFLSICQFGKRISICELFDAYLIFHKDEKGCLKEQINQDQKNDDDNI
jgi:hypothetical protein